MFRRRHAVHVGLDSSHLRWRLRHVRQPVKVRDRGSSRLSFLPGFSALDWRRVAVLADIAWGIQRRKQYEAMEEGVSECDKKKRAQDRKWDPWCLHIMGCLSPPGPPDVSTGMVSEKCGVSHLRTHGFANPFCSNTVAQRGGQKLVPLVATRINRRYSEKMTGKRESGTQSGQFTQPEREGHPEAHSY